jgi:hypothetical protein
MHTYTCTHIRMHIPASHIACILQSFRSQEPLPEAGWLWRAAFGQAPVHMNTHILVRILHLYDSSVDINTHILVRILHEDDSHTSTILTGSNIRSRKLRICTQTTSEDLLKLLKHCYSEGLHWTALLLQFSEDLLKQCHTHNTQTPTCCFHRVAWAYKFTCMLQPSDCYSSS